MKHFLLGAVFGALLLIFGALLYLRLGFAEVRGDLPPSAGESRLMNSEIGRASCRERV